MRAELATEEQALLALVDEYQSSLAAATRQREALESLLRDREQALQEERDTVAQRLEQLRANQEQKRLVLDQLLGHYGRIQQSLDEGDVEEAALRIASLREYVETGPVAHVEDLRTRKDVELFLIETLEERVDAAQTPADSGGAELAELEAERERSAELSARLQETTDRLAATAESLDGARTAIASLRAFVQRQQELADGIDAYRRSFRARSQEADGGRGLPLELLEVKLQVLQILASESVRTEYPDLYHGLNDYLDALVVEQRTDAVRAALRELSTLLDSLGSPGAGPASGRTETSSAYPVLTGPETVGETARLLEALERVVAKMTAKDQE
jgi:DNA repair exonuclease SbcCD ATPase subunit